LIVLTKGDDYPLHQTPEPIAYTGAVRNFYDRFFFNGYARDGSVFFAGAMGIYPYLNVMDGAFSVVLDGVQYNVLGSKNMHMERLDTHVGHVAIDIVEPLRVLRLRCDDGANGIKADLIFEARCEVHEEPRFTRYTGSQVSMDCSRLTQHGVWSGWIEVKDKRIEVTTDVFRGTRDRSWGIRGIGAMDPQPNPAPGIRQFYWLWAQIHFDDCATHYSLNADAEGIPLNTAGAVMPLLGEGDEEAMAKVSSELTFRSGTRHARHATLRFEHRGGALTRIEMTPKLHFYTRGIGYGHPVFGHGKYNGELKTGYEEYVTAEMEPTNLHIQAFCEVKMITATEEKLGVGVLEQLIMGPHEPSGFKDTLDMAP
jgi:hypothetical protein